LNIIKNLLELLKRPNVDFCPATESCFKMASYIKSKDQRLNDTDVLITSHAIRDRNSSLLLFMEEKIIKSPVLEDICNKRAVLIGRYM